MKRVIKIDKKKFLKAVKEKSQRQVAKMFNISQQLVNYYSHKFGIYKKKRIIFK